MKLQPRVAALALVAVLAALAAGTGVAAADGDPTPSNTGLGGVLGGVLGPIFPTPTPTTPNPSPGTPIPTPVEAPTPSPTPTPNQTPDTGPPMFLAANGKKYPAAKLVTASKNGKKFFFGEEFDTACYDGPDFRRGMDKLAALARMISRSGRKVVFTVAPNKSAVDTAALDGVNVPHGACSRRGMAQQRKTLDTYRSKYYLPIRRDLTEARGEVYWRGDTHWNNLGATAYAKALARRLSPKVADRLTYEPSKDKRVGDLLVYLGRKGRQSEEVSRGLKPTRATTVTPQPGTPDIDPATITTTDHRWQTTPKKRALPGRTLLIGDSFTYLGLRSIRPVFRSGHYVWTGVTPTEEVADSILESNTIVIEVVQRFVSRSFLIQPYFTDLVEDALARDTKSPHGG